MGLLASATGATMGVMCVCYSRALRKVAYFSSEWPLPLPSAARVQRTLPLEVF
jgi:hypothetical protein